MPKIKKKKAKSRVKNEKSPPVIPPRFQQFLDLFMDYLSIEKGLAENSLEAYRRDLIKYFQFLAKKKNNRL